MKFCAVDSPPGGSSCNTSPLPFPTADSFKCREALKSTRPRPPDLLLSRPTSKLHGRVNFRPLHLSFIQQPHPRQSHHHQCRRTFLLPGQNRKQSASHRGFPKNARFCARYSGDSPANASATPRFSVPRENHNSPCRTYNRNQAIAACSAIPNTLLPINRNPGCSAFTVEIASDQNSFHRFHACREIRPCFLEHLIE